MAAWSFALLLVFVLLIPARARAQSPAPLPDPPVRDGLAVGGSFGPALAGNVGFWPAVRMSTSLGRRIGLDMDAGGMFPRDNSYFRTRWFYAAQLRFLTRARDARGSSRFWIAGPALVTGSELDGEGNVIDSDAAIGAIRIAYGGDRLYTNGTRVASEIGVIGGGSSAPTGIYAGITIQWRPRH